VKLATCRLDGSTRCVRIEDDGAIDLGVDDVGALLAIDGWQEFALGSRGRTIPLDQLDFAPLVPRPSKILCVGLNYSEHILEMGRELPEYPTLFAKFADALIGAYDPIEMPKETTFLDWEAELAVVIGRPARRVDHGLAAEAIAGFSVLNDVTARDWQYRTTQWLQGKTFDGTCPFGPYLVTPDELKGGAAPVVEVAAFVDGDLVQKASTSDLVFGAAELVRYISTITTLRPGDVIATGTPGGVGYARSPRRSLQVGSELITEITSVGRQVNSVVAASVSRTN
jgi:acylpyruvate hydrolase